MSLFFWLRHWFLPPKKTIFFCVLNREHKNDQIQYKINQKANIYNYLMGFFKIFVLLCVVLY
jgi:hypothetical protein